MPPKSKSIFRQPGVKHFQLVHRSQRDPLINDPEASQHILKPFERENVKKGKSRAELEELLADDLAEGKIRQNVGEATLYGVYYDDTEYDYMQHLRTVGVQEDGVDSILIEAPKPKSKKAGKQPALTLPEDILPPIHELPRNYESQQGIPTSIAGFQPDMDPHLRQVLEALEDDAFVDDGLDDNFFQELVEDGELEEGEGLDFEFTEYGIDETEIEEEGQGEVDASWEDRFKKFKQEQKKTENHDSDDEFASEGGDTIGSLRTVSVIGGKRRRRKGSSVASGYSMSSSSMVRHEGLQTLDEKFDQMMLREYGEDDEDDGEFNDEMSQIDEEGSDEAPDLITSRGDFDSMVNEFLNDYEILGRKLRPKLEGETGAEKLDTFRRALGEATIREGADEEEDEEPRFFVEEEDQKDRWDCETILTTYSNLDNHPRMIRARDSKPVPKIILDSKTGLPSVATDAKKPKPKTQEKRSRTVTFVNSEDTDDSEDDKESGPRRAAVGRPRNESKEEKKARKAAVKAAKQNRRAEKKAHQEEFDSELKTQIRKIQQKESHKIKKL